MIGTFPELTDISHVQNLLHYLKQNVMDIKS